MDFWNAYWAFSAFVFGACIGSFLNVCVWRLPRGESLAGAPSHCPRCNRRLRFFPDMVPLLSQLWFRSRCRQCREPYSWRYFWVELFTALMFTACYLRYDVFAPDGMGETERVLSAGAAMVFCAALITLFFIDLEHYEIPDVCILAAVVAGVGKDLILIGRGVRPLWQPLLSTPWKVPLPLSILFGMLAFWALWQFAALASAALGREAMGAGDSLLLGAMGAFLLPWPLLLLAFMIAVGLGTVGGVIGVMLAGREPEAAGAAGEGPPGEEAAPEMPAEGTGEAPRAVGTEEAAGAGASPEAEVPEVPAAERWSGHRGAASLPPDGPGDEPEQPADVSGVEPEVPRLPAASRWGRLWTVAGTWVAVGAVWGGAASAASAGWGRGALVGAGGLVAAALLLLVGIRQWVRGDREWLPQMDAVFEAGDPGPRFIPFGPYLVAGTFLAMLFGRPLVEWYAHSMGLSLAGWQWD